MAEREKIERTKFELLADIQTLRDRLTIAEATLRSMQHSTGDAPVVSIPDGTSMSTLQTADQSYRLEVERHKATESLRQAKAELEIRVAERTAMLNQTVLDLQTAEAYITKALQEKEVLLKEIHHRVKNNLGIVSSLLQMQIRRSHDPQITSILQDSHNRIASIALVHEKLYHSEDLAKIDCARYIQDLTIYLFESYNISENRIKLTMQIGNGYLDIETMIPCGLIINELVSNALKHAFPDDLPGEIQVIFSQTSEADDPTGRQRSILIVQDNGIGLPRDFDIATTNTLGLTLVQGLATQIGATIGINSPQGTTFTIILSQPNPL